MTTEMNEGNAIHASIDAVSYNLSESDVILLSDNESDSEESSASVEIIEEQSIDNIDIIELDDTVDNDDNGSCSVLSVSDSTIVEFDTSVNHFKLDTAPDFIPVNKCCVGKRQNQMAKRLSKRAKRLGNRSKNRSEEDCEIIGLVLTCKKEEERVRFGKDDKLSPPKKRRKKAQSPTRNPSNEDLNTEFSTQPIRNLCKNQNNRNSKLDCSMQTIWNICENVSGEDLNSECQCPERTVLNPCNAISVFPKSKFPTRMIQLSYPNILNDNAIETQKEGLRPIIIDGCNVGFGYGNGTFDMRGIILVIQYFKNRGHKEIVCFLPQRYRHQVKSPSEDKTVEEFEKEQIFSFTPSRILENGKRYTPYDDRYIVQYATERQGIIISNDGYRDLIHEEKSWRETIERRVINFTFARGLFMLPKDPLGHYGPTLDEMLKFP